MKHLVHLDYITEEGVCQEGNVHVWVRIESFFEEVMYLCLRQYNFCIVKPLRSSRRGQLFVVVVFYQSFIADKSIHTQALT